MNSRILFLVSHEMSIYNFRKEMVEAFLERGDEVIISSPKGEKIDELVRMGCIHKDIDINRHGTNIVEDIKLTRYYSKLIKDVSPDIIFSFTIKPNIYGGIAANMHDVSFVPNVTGLGSAVENESFLQKLIILMYRRSFRHAKTVMFQNEENLKFFIDKKIPMKNYKLLPGSGVNLNHFTQLKYPGEEKEINFVFISRIMKEKGIDQYLAAAEQIKEKYPNTNFHICGFCEEEYEEILNEKQEKGTIIYHGLISDIRDILINTHCTIHPTYYPEGLSNVLLESSASARPIITTNRSGCKEVIDDGKNGFLVEEKNTKDLIDKIEKFIGLDNSIKKEMGIYGRRKVEKEFNRDTVVKAYIDELH